MVIPCKFHQHCSSRLQDIIGLLLGYQPSLGTVPSSVATVAEVVAVNDDSCSLLMSCSTLSRIASSSLRSCRTSLDSCLSRGSPFTSNTHTHVHWVQASCSCVQGITRPATTVPGWRLSALDRHRPPITAIGWCLDVCHKKNMNASRRQEFFCRWTVSLELSACYITWQRHLTCTV